MNNFIENRFKDKVIIVTGAADGIGKQVAIRAAKEGAKLVLVDLKSEQSEKTLQEIKKITNNVDFIIADLRETSNCKKVIDTAIEKYGVIDVLINNAGITGTPAAVDIMPEERYRDVLNNNLMSVFNCSKFALQEMLKDNRGGVIVNVSSVAGLVGTPSNSAYVSSKHAINGLTRNMALDYATKNIRVNAVNPGATETPMYYEALDYLKNKRLEEEKLGLPHDDSIVAFKIKSPQVRLIQPEEVANAILFLASNEASSITGVFLPVDGGYTAY